MLTTPPLSATLPPALPALTATLVVIPLTISIDPLTISIDTDDNGARDSTLLGPLPLIQHAPRAVPIAELRLALRPERGLSSRGVEALAVVELYGARARPRPVRAAAWVVRVGGVVGGEGAGDGADEWPDGRRRRAEEAHVDFDRRPGGDVVGVPWDEL